MKYYWSEIWGEIETKKIFLGDTEVTTEETTEVTTELTTEVRYFRDGGGCIF